MSGMKKHAQSGKSKKKGTIPHPEKEIAFAKRIWGEPLPQWVRAGLERAGMVVEDDEASPDELEPT